MELGKVIKPKKFIYCPFCATPFVDEIVDDLQVQKCMTCGFINWMDPKPTMSILLMQKDTVLMLRRAVEPLKGYWVLPGGFGRYTETPEKSIVRETKEEIGLVPVLHGVIDANLIDTDPRGLHVNIFYEGTIHGNIVLSQEHDMYRWYTPEHLPEHVGYYHREVITNWFKRKIYEKS